MMKMLCKLLFTKQAKAPHDYINKRANNDYVVTFLTKWIISLNVGFIHQYVDEYAVVEM